jgi:hypothetical protein
VKKASTQGKARTRKQTVRKESPASFGWPVREYFPHKIGFGGPTTFHALPEEAKPKHIYIGNKIIIIEEAREYAARLASLSEKHPIQLRRAANGEPDTGKQRVEAATKAKRAERAAA